MAKYEVMLITDPKYEKEELQSFLGETFKNKLEKFEKMERTELTYKINNTLTASYYLFLVEANSDEVQEFIRKSNLIKTSIWRFIVINLDSERGFKNPVKKKPPKFNKPQGNYQKPSFSKQNKRKAFNSNQSGERKRDE